jgi:pilus assembly protein Flp/PilA
MDLISLCFPHFGKMIEKSSGLAAAYALFFRCWLQSQHGWLLQCTCVRSANYWWDVLHKPDLSRHGRALTSVRESQMNHLCVGKQSIRIRQRGQGMTEYIIITALIAIAAIGVFTYFGHTVRAQVGGMAHELSGTSATDDIQAAKRTADNAAGQGQKDKTLNSYNNNVSGSGG